MSSTLHSQATVDAKEVPPCHAPKKRPDWFLWACLGGVVMLYLLHWLAPALLAGTGWLSMLSHSVFELANTIWWGVLAGMVMIALLSRIPREFVMSALGTRTGARGIVRATMAGVLLDLCNHGILMVAAKLYERGVSTGQVMAFLVASPWNSFSLTLILLAMIGLPWTLAFIALSMVVAVVTGLLFDWLISRRTLPGNPNQIEMPEDFRFWPEARSQLAAAEFSLTVLKDMAADGIKESRMVVRWILFGVLLASAVRAFVDPEMFAEYFGPTLLGLGVTLGVATILEVCSEGTTPVAADILTRAGAPGNSFAFLMGGVATDYTEIMVIKDATSSVKVAFFLPLLTLPQVVLAGWLINQLAT